MSEERQETCVRCGHPIIPPGDIVAILLGEGLVHGGGCPVIVETRDTEPMPPPTQRTGDAGRVATLPPAPLDDGAGHDDPFAGWLGPSRR